MHEQVDDTYSPTPTAESVRTCLTLAVARNWIIKFTDVSTAFLHANVIGNKYVYPPESENLGGTNKVWKLKKALYGLKSAPKAWTKHLADLLITLGWTRSVLDECVFFKKKPITGKDKVTTATNFPISGIIVTYVDDLIVSGEKAVVDKFYHVFTKSVTCSPPESLEVGAKPITFLGFEYERTKDRIIINPQKYVEKVLEAFSVEKTKTRVTPGVQGPFHIDPHNRESPRLDAKKHKLYRRLVGQCLWLSNVRRDIAYAVKELSKFVHAPTMEDWDKGIHLLKYLAGTMTDCIHLHPTENHKIILTAHTDADLGGCVSSRKSTSGGCIAINGSIIHTWAKQQSTVADSSAESEFIGMVQAMKEIAYLYQVIDEFGIVPEQIPILYIDNTAAIKMVTENLKGRVKHLDRKVYWIRDFVGNDNLKVHHIDGRIHLADIFTKYVSSDVLNTLRPSVMGRTSPPRLDQLPIKSKKKPEVEPESD